MQSAVTTRLSRALSALLAASEEGFRGAWDCARGFRGVPLLIGTVFPLSIISLALSRPELDAEAGRAIAQREADVMAALAGDDGWRYFNLYPGIPPDTDDLAQMIRLFGVLDPARRDLLLEAPLQLLRRNFHPEGGCFTWLVEDPAQALAVCQSWMPGDDPRHPEVAANLLEALARYRPDDFRDELERGADYLLSCREAEGWASYNYYGWGYGTMIVLKALRAIAEQLPERAHDLAAAADDAGRRLLADQAPEGGWAPRRGAYPAADPRDGQAVSPQETAFVLSALASLEGWVPGPWRDAMPRAAEILLGSQEDDGAWADEPFYFTLGRLPYRSREVTTAHVLDALLSIRPYLPKADPQACRQA